MSNEQTANDLTLVYLQKHIDENASREEIFSKYKETLIIFEGLVKEPIGKVTFLDKHKLGL